MVEGPGCKVKGEKMKPRIKGQQVVSFGGSCVSHKSRALQGQTKGADHKPQPDKSHLESQLSQIIGCTISDVQTLGKELFIFFENIVHCLRVHFLMSGSFRVNNQKLDHEGGASSGEPTLVVQLSQDRVCFYQSSHQVRLASQCLDRIHNLHTLDICHAEFSHKRASELIQTQTGRMLCDILLDQDILPGVGNIIKNEALFDSGIKPDSKLDDLKHNQISHLIRMTRDFSMLFYKCRRDGKPLGPHLKIYRKTQCKQCGSKIVTTRMGEANDRLTSFCPKCQDNTCGIQSFAKKNSLLGWVSTSATTTTTESFKTPEWSCCQCTFLNEGTRTSCQICLAVRVKPDKPDVGDILSSTKHNVKNVKLQTSQGSVEKRCQSDFETIPASKRPKIEKPQVGLPVIKSESTESSGSQSVAKIRGPLCTQHKVPCIMRQVHKKGDNLHRMFWSCPTRKGCNYFKWADDDFPLCTGHGERTVLRTVLKQGENNGRKFFACIHPKNKQCGFFLWADQY